jgi:long-chain fatty acid transport protein
MSRRVSIIALQLTLAVAAPAASATNGYFAHGYGTISKGMAGTGAAFSQDAIAAATNPAGMAFVGTRVDAGLELFSPRREFSVAGGGDPQPGAFYLREGRRTSGGEYFLIPDFGYNRALGETRTVGLTVFANGGMNTDWDGGDGGAFFAGRAGVDLAQLFVVPSWTWRARPAQAFGVAPVFAWQRFEIKGVDSFAPFSAAPEALSNNGRDSAWGYGLQLGWQGELAPRLRAGLSWRSRIRMGEFDRYRGLFAEQGGFDIPQMINAGIGWTAPAGHVLLFDVQHIRYSEVDSVGNPLLPNLATARLGDDDGAGFGWRDMTAFKLGWQWEQDTRNTWRAGLSYAEQPIPASETLFNILAPGVQEWHLTGGFSRRLQSGLTLSGMAFYSPAETVRGPNPLGPGQDISLRMYQLGASLSLAWQF